MSRVEKDEVTDQLAVAECHSYLAVSLLLEVNKAHIPNLLKSGALLLLPALQNQIYS